MLKVLYYIEMAASHQNATYLSVVSIAFQIGFFKPNS